MALAVGLAALALVPAETTRATKDGGTFRVGVNGDFFVAIDPVLAGRAAAFFLQATCAGLMRTRDEPLPTGLNVVPDIATGFPKITNHGKTYTFTIRKEIRFSNGAPVTSRSFAYTINRLLSPQLQAAGADPYYKGPDHITSIASSAT
jgi:ABC-type transport system substrate-binding protein